jgi:NADPH:quinone reductase
MKYFEVRRFGGPEVLEFIEEPGDGTNPDEGMALVQVKAAGINYADIMARSGIYPPVANTPFRPGFEVAGIVSQVGRGVKNLAVGDAVAGLCFAGGGYSTHALVPGQVLYKLPAGVGFASAAALLVQGLTAYFLIEESRLDKGETVLIAGAAGGLGSIAVQIAVRRGARVIGLASASKHEFVLRNGAKAVCTYDLPGWSTQVLKHTVGQGVNVFIDSQGDMSDEDAYGSLARGGRWLIHSWMDECRAGFPGDKIREFVFKNLSIRGYSADWSVHEYPRALADLFSWISDGSLQLKITKFPLEEAAKAHTAISSRATTGKVILIP